ncbi:17374_t:CDS:1, partial [Gigaspora rosea]
RHVGASSVVVLKCHGSVALLAYVADEYVCLSSLCLCSSENVLASWLHRWDCVMRY